MLQNLKKLLQSKGIGSETLRWLWTILTPMRAKLAWLILFRCCITMVGIGSTVVNKYLVDYASAYLDVTGIIVLTVVCSGVNLLGGMLLSLLAVQLTERFSLHIRSSLYARILDGVWAHRARFHSEDLLSRLTSDVGRVSDGIVTAATTLISTAVQFCLAFGLLCLYDKTIALFTLASVPCIAVLTLLLGLRLKELQVRQQQAEADYRVYLQEQLSAADVVKAFEAEAESCRRFAALQERRIRLVMRSNRYSIAMRFGVNAAFVSAYLFAFITGAQKIATGAISFGTMTAFLTLVNQVQAPALSLSRIVSQLIAVTASASRLLEIAALPQEPSQTASTGLSRPVGLTASGLSFHYETELDVLKDVSFSIAPGQIAAIMGHSGVGKTTLIRLILGYLRPLEGTIVLQDAQTQRPCSPGTRGLISYVPQGNTLFSGTIAENLRLGLPAATPAEMWDALRMACADTFVVALPAGLETRIGERGHGLSEGQAQRIAIARAFLRPAPILILDEATSALDEKTELAILTQLRERRAGQTCLVISHRGTVTEFADQLIEIGP